MKKYIGAIVGVLFFVGMIALAANMSDGEIDFFSDSEVNYVDSNYNGNIYMPSMNVNAQTLRNWTGSYWNFSMYNNYNLFVRNATVVMQYSTSSYYYANVYFVFDAQDNSTYSNYSSNYSVPSAYFQTSSAWLNGPNSNYVYISNTTYSPNLNLSHFEELLKYYCWYVVQPRLDAIFYSNQTQNSSSNTSNTSNTSNASNTSNTSNASNTSNTSNASNKTNSSNTSNQSWYPDPIYGRSNLTVSLPSQNISWNNISIYVYNATFYGNSTGSSDYKGRIYAKFNANALIPNGWYSSLVYIYGEEVIYDAWNAYSCNGYYNYTLIPAHNNTLRDILFNYYWDYAKPAILSAISNSSNSTNNTQALPYALLKGENLTSWYNASWWVFSNYTSVNYAVSVWSANFTGSVGKNNASGRISLTFDAYGNNSYTPAYNQSQIWEYSVGATIDFDNSWFSSISFDRTLAIYPSDLRNFLRAWVMFQVVPYLLSNSSNTTGIRFPARNITGFDLNDWIGRYNAYPNYTWAGYFVNVSNVSPSLYQSGNDVYGYVNLSFVAYGNDTAYPCWGWSCNQTAVWSNATIYVNGVQSNYSLPDIYVDWYLRVNYTDVQNFLRGYFYGVMVPIIYNYYNITPNTTANTTIYLPSYYNNTQLTIDCSRSSWYCSGANPQSYLYFLNAYAYNLSITVNNRGNGYFNGKLQLPYTANLINFTSTYYGKETIVSNVQGNATLSLWGWVNGTGNNSYYVTLSDYSYADVVFDRNYFVQNAAQRLYSDRLQWNLQYFVNSILGNGSRYY